MTTWRITNPRLEERELDYTATFTCTNGETGRAVSVSLQQQKGGPASDLISALRAVTQIMYKAATTDDESGEPPPRLN
jgi:hypothetical protein